MTVRSFMLKYDTKNHLEKRAYVLKCFHCGEPLHPGEKVVSKGTKYRQRKYYHSECWDSLFL